MNLVKILAESNGQAEVQFGSWGMVCFELVAPDILELHFIRSYQPGGGSYVLRQMTDVADRLGLTLKLHVHPIPSYAKSVGLKPLSKKNLRAWYERNGFVGETYSLERKPK